MCLFSRCYVVFAQTPTTGFDNLIGGFPCLLVKYLHNQNYILVYPINNSPFGPRILHAQFMTAWPNARHRPRIRHRQQLAALQSAKQPARLNSRFGGKRRCLNFTMQPAKLAFFLLSLFLPYIRIDIFINPYFFIIFSSPFRLAFRFRRQVIRAHSDLTTLPIPHVELLQKMQQLNTAAGMDRRLTPFANA